MLKGIYLRRLVASLFSMIEFGRKRGPYRRRKEPLPEALRSRPFLETLEERLIPTGSTYYQVTGLSDSNGGSLLGGAPARQEVPTRRRRCAPPSQLPTRRIARAAPSSNSSRP